MWSEEKKFIFETLRTIFFAVGAFVASLFIAESIRSQSAYDAFLQRERIALKKEVIDSMLVLNFTYSTLYFDKVQGRGDGESLEKSYDDLRNNLNRASVYFGDETDSLIEEAVEILRLDMRPLKFEGIPVERRSEYNKKRKDLKTRINKIAESALREIEL